MRKITTAITAAALAFSMLAQAVPAAAVAGYDSAYAGESAFVNISAGQTQNFQVFFANTGTTAWQRGTATQVDLAACLEDKVTCNAQDASEATWNSGWLSSVRYASTTQTTTPPGSLGTFSYNIAAPTGVAAGIFRFNGDLVLASTGERVHPEGYYQEANTGVGAGVATITSLSPASGPIEGGTDVVISGSGIICTPAFPTVSFGGTNATVLSCGSTSVTADAPAHAAGSVTVTVTNTGAGASNGLSYLYEDLTGPTFTSMTISGNIMTVTFNEPVCSTSTTATAASWTVRNIANPSLDLATTADSDNLTTDCDDAVSTYTIILDSNVPNGSFVEATLEDGDGTLDSENNFITDAAGNGAAAPTSRQSTATAPETTKPTMVSASGAVGTTTVKITFSEAVFCTSLEEDDFSFSDGTSDADPTVTAGGITGCGTTQSTADSSINLTVSFALPADKTYVITATPELDELQDVSFNDLASGGTVTFTTGAGDFTPPTLIDARLTLNVGTTNFTDAGDKFTVTFSEEMDGTESPDRHIGSISIQDQDGTTATINCTAAAAANDSASCTWNAAITTLTVTLDSVLLDNDGLTPVDSSTGTTPGMQIPFNITAMTGFVDTASPGNPPNVLGSADRLVDYE